MKWEIGACGISGIETVQDDVVYTDKTGWSGSQHGR